MPAAAHAARRDTHDDTPASSAAPDPAAPLSIALLGDGAAGQWATALRSVDGVRVTAAPESDLTELLTRADIRAICIAGQMHDLPQAIRRTLLARMDVLVAVPAVVASNHLRDIGDIATRRSAVVMLDTPDLADEQIAFVRRMTSSRRNRAQPLLRPRYIRAVRTGSCDATPPELAVGEIATVLAVAGELPAAVSAFSVSNDASAPAALMMTLTFPGGSVARVDIGQMEPAPRSEVVVACSDRTFVLTDLGAQSSLRIESWSHRSAARAGRWAQASVERPAGPAAPHPFSVAAAFVAAVRSRNPRKVMSRRSDTRRSYGKPRARPSRAREIWYRSLAMTPPRRARGCS
jgi:hypothetical protein